MDLTVSHAAVSPAGSPVGMSSGVVHIMVLAPALAELRSDHCEPAFAAILCTLLVQPLRRGAWCALVQMPRTVPFGFAPELLFSRDACAARTVALRW
mgnify:CR=1 FL=1